VKDGGGSHLLFHYSYSFLLTADLSIYYYLVEVRVRRRRGIERRKIDLQNANTKERSCGGDIKQCNRQCSGGYVDIIGHLLV